MTHADEIQVFRGNAATLPLSQPAICRYLGMGKAAPDAALQALLAQTQTMLCAEVQPRACFRVVSLCVREAAVDAGGLLLPGKDLARHLEACTQGIVFAATLGAQFERLQKRVAVRSPAQALVLDAVGTATIEAFCDVLCERWRTEFEPWVLRPRYSPGYGDLPLECQRPLLGFLDSGRKAGIYLTQTLLMTPQKSVSALVGIGRAECTGGAAASPCAACGNEGCAFR